MTHVATEATLSSGSNSDRRRSPNGGNLNVSSEEMGTTTTTNNVSSSSSSSSLPTNSNGQTSESSHTNANSTMSPGNNGNHNHNTTARAAVHVPSHREIQVDVDPRYLLNLCTSTIQMFVWKTITFCQTLLQCIVQCIIFTCFTNYMSTKQLYTVSIVLLCIQLFVQKLLDNLPRILMRLYLYIAGEDATALSLSSSSSALLTFHKIDLREFVHTDSKWIASEIEAMERLLDQILNSGAKDLGVHHHFLQENVTTTVSSLLSNKDMMNVSSSFSLNNILETPITSLMLPTTVLSLFLLMTMTLFLLFHVLYQALLHISCFFSNTTRSATATATITTTSQSDGSTHGHHTINAHSGERMTMTGSSIPFSQLHSQPLTFPSSSVAVAGFMLLLILENLIPWIAFGMGVYLSLAMGGVTWFLFTAATYLVCYGLKKMRTRIMIWLQDNNGPRLY